MSADRAPLRVVSPPLGTNTWLVEGAGGACLVIDPGLDQAALDAALAGAGLRPAAVLCTHGHFDHVAGAAALQARHGVPVWLHRADQRVLRSSSFLMMALRVPGRFEQPAPSWVDDEAVVEAAGLTARFVHVPGHTPGSCVIRVGEAAFTGDTLTRDGVGRSPLPGGDEAALRRSLARLWELLPGEARAFPGHGGAAAVDEVRRGNAEARRLLGLLSSGSGSGSGSMGEVGT